MPLPGGASDKFGSRYEGRWTVQCMLDVLDEKADSIRLEPPGPGGDGVEFWVNRGGDKEYHQVKRQRSAGPWTVNALAQEGVLQHFAEKLKDPDAHSVFVSGTSAEQLRELSERARGAASWEEFDAEFLKDDQNRKDFNLFCKSVGNPPAKEAYEYLRRIRAEGITETLLRSIVESRASTLVEGDCSTVVDVLAEMALELVHHELTAIEIWNRLEGKGFSRRHWNKDPHVLTAVEKANQRYLKFLRDQAIGGNVLYRDEVQTVQTLLEVANDKAGVLVTGEAGVGKSGVMLQVVEKILDEGAPVVAFRVDRLEPTQLPDKVGEQMGLPGSPANVLAAIAQNKYCVLVIDQLDAISLASGRNSEVFDCISEIISQARAYDNMRILLACRKFDLDNDHRLRNLVSPNGIAEPVTVNRLTSETVRGVVSGFGLDANLLRPKQLDLLSVPLHLKLLSELAAVEDIRALNFETALDLYRRFWQQKQQAIRERVGRQVQWAKVVYALCDYMHERQTLATPEYVLDEWNADAEAMASENVLVLDDKRYSFFHEGFFDYSYARRFAASNQSLLDLLTQDEQDLFRRTQVRQILLYLREAEFDKYILYLGEVLSSPGVRFHLKQVVFALLADLSDPYLEEWEVLSAFAGRDFGDPITRQAWGVLRRSTPWFLLVDSIGLVRQWLEDSEDPFIDQTIMLLWPVQRQLPDKVAELLEPYVGKSERWNQRLLHVAQWADWFRGRRFLELIVRLMDEGILDEAEGQLAVNSDFWSLLYSIGSTRLEWGCEIIGHYLNRRHQLSLEASQPNPFDYQSGTIPSSQSSEEVLTKCARGAPGAFIREVFPFMQAVLEVTAEASQDELRLDPNWRNRIYQSNYPIEDTLLNAMGIALSELATENPGMYRSMIGPLRASPFETIQFLLLTSLASNGPQFADDGANHLCENPECLNIGYDSHPHWVARQLIEAISPYCSDDNLDQLENLLLGYYSSWEKSELGRPQWGYAQFTLLSGISDSRRSKEVNKRLAELQRKFGKQEPQLPKRMEAEFVGSPLPDGAAEKMTDGQWLSAISRHNKGERIYERDGRLVGGALQLSQDLKNQVKLNPERFAELAMRIPDDAHPAFFEAILRGLCDVEIDIATIVEVCVRCHEIEGRPLGQSICDLIANAANQDVPYAAIALVAWYATEDPDPCQELWKVTTPRGEDFYYHGNIFENGINTVRGRAAIAIAQLLFHDQTRIVSCHTVLEKMVKDPSVAVRACVAEVLLAVLNHEEDLAIKLFQELCHTEEGLLRTPFVERFLFFALRNDFQSLSQILEGMVNSKNTEVSSAGARQACLAALDLQEAVPLAELCLSGSEAQRIGAAQIMAANVKTATYRSFCEGSLIKLLNDHSPKVCAEASRCFGRLEDSELGEHNSLVTEFVHSQAFHDNGHFLFRALEQTTAKLPDATLLACEKFIEVAELAAADIRTRQAGDPHYVIQLTLRAHQQSSDYTRRAKSLDLIDKLMEYGAYGVESALENFDR